MKLGQKGAVRAAVLVDTARVRVLSWRRRAALAGVAALAVGMAYGVMFGHNGLTVFAHKRQETKDLQHEMQQLQTENDRLTGHVQRLANDPAAIEHQAREELHYTRGGEVIVTMPVKPASAQTVSSQPE